MESGVTNLNGKVYGGRGTKFNITKLPNWMIFFNSSFTWFSDL